MNFNTRAIHEGQEPEETTGAVNVPVFLSSTYAQESVGVVKFADYGRGTTHARGPRDGARQSRTGKVLRGVLFGTLRDRRDVKDTEAR